MFDEDEALQIRPKKKVLMSCKKTGLYALKPIWFSLKRMISCKEKGYIT